MRAQSSVSNGNDYKILYEVTKQVGRFVLKWTKRCFQLEYRSGCLIQLISVAFKGTNSVFNLKDNTKQLQLL